MINPKTGKQYLINQTSVDDMRSSLKLRDDVDEIRLALNDELKRQKRTTVIALLKARIKQLRKIEDGRDG
jgi:hypothetical protein